MCAMRLARLVRVREVLERGVLVGEVLVGGVGEVVACYYAERTAPLAWDSRLSYSFQASAMKKV